MRGGYGWKVGGQKLIFSTLSVVEGSVASFRINTTVRALTPNEGPNCTIVLLSAWAQGYDPGWRIAFCSVPPTPRISQTNTTNATATVGTLVLSTGDPQAKLTVIIKGEATPDQWFRITTGILGHTNNWLLMAEQAANASRQDCIVCMGPRPLLKITPSLIPPPCIVHVMTQTNPPGNCSQWDKIHPLAKSVKIKPLFSTEVALTNHTCVNFTGSTLLIASRLQCSKILMFQNKSEQILSRLDVWWWCGDNAIYDRLPKNASGVCALVTLLLPIKVFPTSADDIAVMELLGHRLKRSTTSGPDPTYIDAIGIPRGVPDEYKLADQVAAGFESVICWWCTIKKNVDRINYIHYNVQRLSNWTQEGFSAVHEQLAATSVMAFQNRIEIDMILAEKGGVCAIFGDQCCTFIPNNTAADGKLSHAIEGLRVLNKKMKEHSGVNTDFWSDWMNVFGAYKGLVSSILISVAVFTAILTTCGCCLIPCVRALMVKLIERAVGPAVDESVKIHLLSIQGGDEMEADLIDLSEDEYEME